MRDRAYERYVEAVEAASALAQEEIEAFVSRLDLSRKAESRDALLAFVPAVVERYGDIAAEAARDYYEQERRRQIGGSYRAKAFPMGEEEREALLESVRYHCGILFEEDGDG